MFAIIARGLGSEVDALDIGEALEREGLNELTFTRVLTHLEAPELDFKRRRMYRL
jgi:hypothetical protein